jgi:imidazolonepropionase
MLLINATLAAMDGSPAYGLVEQGAVAIEKGLIAWAGRGDAIPAQFKAGEVIDLEGRLVTPALIDCHTHVVHGGNRAREFEMRLEGSSYEEIARSGGGIVSTVAATRAATKDELVSGALARVDAMIAEGVSTIEIKSGYGLDIDNELKMLRAARAVAERRPVRVRTSFLGAHAVPPEYRGRPDAYIGEVCIPGLEAAHAEGLVDAVDGFCEGIAFTPEQIAQVFDKARARGIPVKLHAEQLSNLGGASWQPNTARCPPIISNMPRQTMRQPWRKPAVWQSSCPAPSTHCGRQLLRQSRRSAKPVSRWRSPPIATPARRRCHRCF